MNENGSRRWMDVPSEGETQALIQNMMYLGRGNTNAQTWIQS